jgi:hypothetical protein
VEAYEDGRADVFGKALGDVFATFVNKKKLMAAMNRIKAITAIRCSMRLRPPRFGVESKSARIIIRVPLVWV